MDFKYLNDTGVIVPDTESIFQEVADEFRNALGQSLVVTPDTPQGALIASETVARETIVANNAALANQINPNIAGGVFLDAICALLGLERTAETATRVPLVTLSGVPGTVIPFGSRARDAAGNLFYTVSGVSLGADGTARVDMVSEVTGPVTAPVGAVSTVVDTVLGWESVTNTTAGDVGNVEQSDASLRQLRRDTLARQGVSLREAQLSALNDLDDVRSVVFRENYSDADSVIDGVFLKKHSVWTCIDGGTDQAIARILLSSKSAGANWNGDTLVSYVDPISGQTYPVRFDRAVLVPVYVTVTVKRNGDPSDATKVIPQAIVNYANGLIPDDAGLRIGVPVSPWEIAAAVNYYHPGFTVKNVGLTTGTGVPQSVEIPITLKQRARIELSYVTVVVQE